MTDRLLLVARYCALLQESGLSDANPARAALADLLDEYLDGGDLDEAAAGAALARIEAQAAHPALLAQAAAAGVVRKARVLPSPPEVRLVVRQLRAAHAGAATQASSSADNTSSTTSPVTRQA